MLHMESGNKSDDAFKDSPVTPEKQQNLPNATVSSARSSQRWRLLSRAVRSKTYESFDDEEGTTPSEIMSSGISSAGSSSSGLNYPYYPYQPQWEQFKTSSFPHHLSPPVSPESSLGHGDSDNDTDGVLAGSISPLKFLTPSNQVPQQQQQQPYAFNIKTYGFMKYNLHRVATSPSLLNTGETLDDSEESANSSEKWIVCKWNFDVVESQSQSYHDFYLHLKLVENRLTFQDLAGFDNSGNVRIWPCEELLAYLVTFGILKDKVENKVVLELGAGMTALAGLSLAYFNQCRRLYFTDGNRRCVKNIEAIVDRNFERAVDNNKLHPGKGKIVKISLTKEVRVQQLRWGIVSDYQHLKGKLEVILGADCLFVQRSHVDLLNTIDALLVEGSGSAFLLAPRRGNTLQEWIDYTRKDGRFTIDLFESFCSCFASLYQELYQQNPFGWNHDAYFPFLLVMTRNISDLSNGRFCESDKPT